MKYILGIDIGTGSTKAVAIDLGYKSVLSCQHHYPTFSSSPGYSEQDPEVIWQAFVRCINDTVNHRGSTPEAISLSSAMHSVIAVDHRGQALAPMMTWADSRSTAIAEQIRATDVGRNIYRSTGTPIHAMSPLCKLIWLRENQPELFSTAYKFISIKEYIWYRLFDEFSIDHSIASSTGLFDIEQRIWSTDALELAEINSSRLSEPVSTSYIRKGLSPSSAVLFKVHDTSFIIGASDGCLANLGTHANIPGTAALTIGTSGAVRVASTKPVFNNETMIFSYLLDEQTYICGGPVNNGGITLQWLLRNITGREELTPGDYTELFSQVESTEAGSNGLLFLPYLTGERAPIWDTASCGTFFGLRLHHGQPHFARSVLEGICYALNDVLEAVAQDAGEIKEINVSGGFVHSTVWMQILADITGKNIILVQTEDASAIGATYLAVKAIGLEEQYPSPQGTNKEVIKPDLKKHECYRKYFMVYKQLYKDLKQTMRLLNDMVLH